MKNLVEFHVRIERFEIASRLVQRRKLRGAAQ